MYVQARTIINKQCFGLDRKRQLQHSCLITSCWAYQCQLSRLSAMHLHLIQLKTIETNNQQKL